MSLALNHTGRPIFFNLCEWGVDSPWLWAAKNGNSWRTGPDHHDIWGGTNGVASMIELNAGLSQYAAPGGWNDMDFIMTGGEGCPNNPNKICPGMTETEYVTEFSMWALLNSPLIVSTDISGAAFTPFKKQVLMNAEVIALNQDKLGVQGDRVALYSCPNGSEGLLTCQIWAKPLYDGGKGVMLYNRGNTTQIIKWNFGTVGWAGAVVHLRDLWKHQDLGSFTSVFAAAVEAHGVVALKATRVK